MLNGIGVIMKKMIIILALLFSVFFAGTASAYYDAYGYDYYYDYPGYDYYYDAYTDYYPDYYDSYYVYYEEHPQEADYVSYDVQAQCESPYGAEGQRRCFDSSLYICKSGSWAFDRDVSCCSADECQPEQSGDYCRYSKSCSNYACTSGSQAYCPEPGSTKSGMCYYGGRECTKSGCSMKKCMLQKNQGCDANEGCVDLPCDASACDSKDGWYCLGGDVTREFRDYYCTHDTGQSCSYSISEKETEKDRWICDGDYRTLLHWSCRDGELYSDESQSTLCDNGCDNGKCLSKTCDESECDDNDGFYGDSFCRSGDVYRQYRSYYCSGSSCSYTTENRRAENCDNGCEDGECTDGQNDEDCGDRDGFYGERFCKYGDLYQEYRNYYTSGGSCDYSTEDRLRESCDDGCSYGQCSGSNAVCERYVDIRDNEFYPQTITVPRGTVVIWTNRDGRDHTVTSDGGDFNSGTMDSDEVYKRMFSETGEYDYHCSIHSDEQGTVRVTSDSSCSKCDSDCDSRDGFYGDTLCLNGNVYRQYRNYYCSGTSCIYSDENRVVESCSGGCESGRCTRVRCDDKCDEWGEWQKLSGQANDALRASMGWMERRRTCYSYTSAEGSCALSKTYTVIQRASDSGVGGAEKSKSYEFGFAVQSSFEEKAVSREPVKLYNGLIFGSNSVSFKLKKGDYAGDLSLMVDSTNYYGELLILLNDGLLQSKELAPGTYTVAVGRTMEEDSELEIMAASSSWRLWAPATYEISQISLSTKSETVEKRGFDFELYQDEYDGFVSGSINATQDGFTVLLNGKRIEGKTFGKDSVRVGANTVELVPEKGRKAEGKIILDIFYST